MTVSLHGGYAPWGLSNTGGRSNIVGTQHIYTLGFFIMAETRRKTNSASSAPPCGIPAGVYGQPRNVLNRFLVQGIEPGGQLTTTTEVGKTAPVTVEVQGPDLMIACRPTAQGDGNLFTDPGPVQPPLSTPKATAAQTYVAMR